MLYVISKAKMKSSILILLSAFFFTSVNCSGQGGWNIGYISVDSLGKQDISRDLKIDFRSESDTLNTIPSFIMNLVAIEDTVTLYMDGEKVTFIEQRNIHLDWGFYDEQFLECPNAPHNKVIRVYHTVIEEITTDSILFRLYIEQYDKYKKGKVKVGTIPRRRTESVWIEKKIIKGVMIKK